MTDSTPTPDLRQSAFRVVTLTDALRQWDEAHGHVINSDRDEISGWLSEAWDDLRAILATQPEPLDEERLARAAHRSYDRDPAVKRIEWHDLSDFDRSMWRRHAAAIAAEYDRLSTEEPHD